MIKVDIQEYKEIVLSVLVRIDRICREHGLTYMLCYGTLLGAVRHQGFIPWDDDVDIIMPREDYNALSELIRAENWGLNFISIETCKETIYPYGKVCDARTMVEEDHFRPVKGYGAFVDVFPMDYLPEDEKAWRAYQKKHIWLRKLITHSARTGFSRTGSPVTNAKRWAAFWAGKLFSTRKLIEGMTSRILAFNQTPTGRVGVVWDLSFPACSARKNSEVVFEGHCFLAPEDPNEVLTRLYGDYWKLPPESERVNKHPLVCHWIGERQSEAKESKEMGV